MEIKISTELPPVYPKLQAEFGVDFIKDRLIICYGDTLHSNFEIPPEKYVHELVHAKRQDIMGIDNWWFEYLNNKEFRLNEELLAYREEYQFISRNISNREVVFSYLYDMAQALSSHVYGNLIEFYEAMRLIKDNTNK